MLWHCRCAIQVAGLVRTLATRRILAVPCAMLERRCIRATAARSSAPTAFGNRVYRAVRAQT
eukprot:3799212-Pyramimonas_sp.AAC.1